MKKTIIIVGLLALLAVLARAETKVSVCIPFFGEIGTVDAAYPVYTEYVIHTSPGYYPPPPPPPLRYYHHHYMPPPPPPPHHFHRPPPPPPRHTPHRDPMRHFKR